MHLKALIFCASTVAVLATDTQRYLLDRVQIESTLDKMYWGFDTARFNVLRDEVFAANIKLDFRALFGGEVQNLSNEELLAYWTKLRNYATTAQHVLTFALESNIQPVSPGTDNKGSDEQKGLSLGNGPVPIFANVLVYLRRDVPGAESKETTADATLDLEVIKERDGNVDNAWRVSSIKANVVRLVKYQEFWADLDQ